MSESIQSVALSGIKRAEEAIAGKADSLTYPRADGQSSDLAEQLIGIKHDVLSYQANAKILKVADVLEQGTLNILA